MSPAPRFVLVACPLCGEDADAAETNAAGLCWPCQVELAARPPEPEPPALADDLARARDRALVRQAAWLAELRERMARLRGRFGEDVGEREAPRRKHGPVGLAANVRRTRDW